MWLEASCCGHLTWVLVDLQAIKVYPQGKMSQHIHNLHLGDTLDIKVGMDVWCACQQSPGHAQAQRALGGAR